VARETHPPPSSGLPGRLPGLGHGRPSAFDLHGDPRRGAADAAPTAPHATAPVGRDRSGPARFWESRRLRIALAVTLTFSAVLHSVLTPWQLLPDTSGIEVKDPEGELTIPIDLLGEDQPPPPPEKPPEQTPPETPPDPNALNARPDAGPRRPKPDASVPDASPLETDGGDLALPQEGGAPVTESDGGAPSDGGLVASADAGGPAGAMGPRDPGGMIGMAGLVSAGTVNVTLLVNINVIKTNPVGARMGPLLFGIPQWQSFVKGSQVAIDPIRDTDWILIYGPSLIHTERDAVIVRYSASDAVVDQAVEQIAKNFAKGGPLDAGVPGIKASLGFADNGQRAFLRVQPHVLVIVPPDKAREFALVMKRAPIQPKVRAGEAMRLTVKNPTHQISVPGLKFSEKLTEIRLWIVPRNSDGGADVYAEGDCTDEAAAADTADALTDVIKRQNSFAVRIATRGLLNGARVIPEGKNVTLHVSVSQEQLEVLLQTLAGVLGVTVQPPSGGGNRANE
jgi:hypothetical protein